MDHLQEFSRILKKEKEAEILPFFQSMNDKERETFIPVLRDICKEYLEYHDTLLKPGSYSFKRKASDRQASMLNVAALICFNEKDFRQWCSPWHMKADEVTGTLKWYCPKWFNKYINSFGEVDFTPMFISYDWIMSLSETQLITPSKELIVKILPQALFERRADNKFNIKPENLLKHPITLDEHIWYFFEMENTVYMSDRYLSFASEVTSKESQWIRCLCEFASQGKIDRHHLLKECILATARNFNKPLAGWFCDLFTTLDPRKEEVLAIQQEILNALNSNHSKPVNTALTALRKVADDAEFDADSFLDSTPLLLASETRTIVNSTLSILEKIAKKHKDKKEAVCVKSCQAFLHADEDIQSKAVRVIHRFGDAQFQELNQTLLKYQGSLLINTKKGLSQTFSADVIDESTLPVPLTSAAAEEDAAPVEIPPVASMDELIFLSSQAFDNNRTFHIDILPAALIAMQAEIRGANIAKLEPALQRAFKLLIDGVLSTNGYLDHLLATFFVDFTKILIERYPLDARPLDVLHRSYERKETELRQREGKYHFMRIFPLSEWRTQNDDLVYEPYKKLLLYALEKLKTQDALPLLSTPTHEPSLISAAVLIKRLQSYAERKVLPESTDFQIAISRCDLSDGQNFIPLLEESLQGEWKNIMHFLLQPGSPPQGPYNLPALWIVAALSRDKSIPPELKAFINPKAINHLTGQFPWESLARDGLVDQYNYNTRKYDKVKTKEKTLHVYIEEVKSTDFSFKALFSGLKFREPEGTQTIYELLKLKKSPFGLVENNDIARLLYLTPNHPEPMLAHVASKALTYNNFFDSRDKSLVSGAVEVLMSLHARYGETGHLFVGTCMLSSDKTVQSFAAEIWSKGVLRKQVDSGLLGKIIGKHESVEFAPLRRLTDLIATNMMNISTKHNTELEILISEVLLRLPKEPITNLKKLLELYFEIISKNDSVVPDNVLQQLKQWRGSGSLKKVIASLSGEV